MPLSIKITTLQIQTQCRSVFAGKLKMTLFCMCIEPSLQKAEVIRKP